MKRGRPESKGVDGNSYELDNAKIEHSLRAVPQECAPAIKNLDSLWSI